MPEGEDPVENVAEGEQKTDEPKADEADKKEGAGDDENTPLTEHQKTNESIDPNHREINESEVCCCCIC